MTADATGPKHLALELTKSKFEQMIDKFVGKTLVPVKKALKDAELKPADIDEVVLVGGSTSYSCSKRGGREILWKGS